MLMSTQCLNTCFPAVNTHCIIFVEGDVYIFPKCAGLRNTPPLYHWVFLGQFSVALFNPNTYRLVRLIFSHEICTSLLCFQLVFCTCIYCSAQSPFILQRIECQNTKHENLKEPYIYSEFQTNMLYLNVVTLTLKQKQVPLINCVNMTSNWAHLENDNTLTGHCSTTEGKFCILKDHHLI